MALFHGIGVAAAGWADCAIIVALHNPGRPPIVNGPKGSSMRAGYSGGGPHPKTLAKPRAARQFTHAAPTQQ
ncbi:hypothetical protein NONI108955_38425 [Nocardia ninae]